MAVDEVNRAGAVCADAKRGAGSRRAVGIAWGALPRAALASFFLLLTACDGSSPELQAPPAAAVDPIVDVATARVRRGAIAQAISAPGALVARRESRIGADVGARIVRVHVSEGDRVAAGDPLFEVDPVAYEMALRQAGAGLDVAQSQRRQLESDLARARELRSEKIVPPQEVERIATTLAVAQAQERQAGELVALARYQLEQTVVRAPYGGSVAARLADEGTTALVQPQTIVIVLQETGELEARASIPESQLTRVHLGDRALIHIEGLVEPIASAVSTVSDTIDLATRTYLVKMRVPNPDYALKAGVFAHIEIQAAGNPDALLVPREAIRAEDGRSRVLLVKDGRADAATVELGVVTEDLAEVLAGVAVDDEVIVGSEAGLIAPGMRVRVAVAEGDAA